jgi:hypothetical protein
MSMFVWGALAMASWVAGLLFLRYWKKSRERLFVMFALAFWSLGLSWAGLAIENRPDETRHYFYILRLIAFLLIICAVIDKNRARDRQS